ncbi:unnamed protein product [Clavelina lepadiformis]|uniref:Uncharacterized protein n=1 Tax=Clavelina lepadiformis TaxID=159417 RepID=A0ABP0EXL5_CLALP
MSIAALQPIQTFLRFKAFRSLQGQNRQLKHDKSLLEAQVAELEETVRHYRQAETQSDARCRNHHHLTPYHRCILSLSCLPLPPQMRPPNPPLFSSPNRTPLNRPSVR